MRNLISKRYNLSGWGCRQVGQGIREGRQHDAAQALASSMLFLVGGGPFDGVFWIGDNAPIFADRTSRGAVGRSGERSFRTSGHRERKSPDVRLQPFDICVVVAALVIGDGAHTPLESQGTGVFHVTVDGFDSVPDTIFL